MSHQHPQPTFVLRIDAYLHAFEGPNGPGDELARILRDVADRLERGESFHYFQDLQDRNGNYCGQAALKPLAYWTDRGERPSA